MNTKKVFLSLFSLISLSLNAQIHTGTGGAGQILANSPTTNVNVGIGTNTPSEKLHIKNGNLLVEETILTNKLRITNSLPNNQTFTSIGDRNSKSVVFTGGTLLSENGFGTIRFFDFPSSNFNNTPQVYFSIEDRNDSRRFNYYANSGDEGIFQLMNKNQEAMLYFEENGNTAKLSLLKPDSYLGIGTNSFNDGTDVYRLSVKGKIRAEEIKVYNTWADYVFEEDYNLEPLSDVEEFIKANRHLKNFPSASEIESEGLSLGEITRIQQEKIEELTLYLIEQNKEIIILRKRIDSLEDNK